MGTFNNVIAVTFIILAVAALVGAFVASQDIAREIFVILGSRNESGGWYGFWSGFGGSVPDIAIITGASAWYLNHTCHDHPTCLRWGKYPAAGGLFKLCRHHHPDMKGNKPNREMIHRLHREHLDRISR